MAININKCLVTLDFWAGEAKNHGTRSWEVGMAIETILGLEIKENVFCFLAKVKIKTLSCVCVLMIFS